MKNSDYWEDRFQYLEEAANREAQNYYYELENQFIAAQKQLENQISLWYQRFATNNKITMSEARKILNKRELAEFRWDVKEYIKYGEQIGLNPEWMEQLENASIKYHVSRLESLKMQTQQTIEVLYGNQTDELDNLMKKIYSNGYYHTAYEIQKGFNTGWDIASIDKTKLETLISKPWALDGQNFSDRVWKNKNGLINGIHTQLTQTCILGKAPDDAIKKLSSKMNTSKNNAGRLIMTESAYFSSVAQKDCFHDLDVEKYEIVATLDSKTSEVCQELDGHVFLMKDYEPGVTAPPFHCWCRTCTVPYFDDDFSPGQRAARNVDGKTYYVSDNIKYEEWKKQYVDSPIKLDQTMKITLKNDHNSFSVDRKLINSKKYHDKFESLTSSKAVNESLYQEAMKMLEHRDGTELEDVVALDARTGKIIIRNTSSLERGKTGFTAKQYTEYQNYPGDVILLHNHPNSSRPSYTDISTMFRESKVVGTVAVGHDGSVHGIYKTITAVDIDTMWKKAYNTLIKKYNNKDIAHHIATDLLYDSKKFIYERR